MYDANRNRTQADDDREVTALFRWAAFCMAQENDYHQWLDSIRALPSPEEVDATARRLGLDGPPF